MNPFENFSLAVEEPPERQKTGGNPFEDFELPQGPVRKTGSGFTLPDDPAEQDKQLRDILRIAREGELPLSHVENNYEQFKGQPSPYVAAGMGGFSPRITYETAPGRLVAPTVRNSLNQINASLELGDSYLNGRGGGQAYLNWRRTQKDIQASQDYMRRHENLTWFDDILLGNIAVATPMVKNAWEALPATFGGAVAGAVIALGVGEVPPMTILPEEIGTVPFGILKGAEIGYTAKSMQFWYRQGVGDFYGEMLQNGIDPKIAGPVASVGAIPYAAIEFIQWKQLTPGLRDGMRQTITRSVVRTLAEAAKKYGETLVRENFEEILQEAVNIAAVDVASYLDGHGVQINKEAFLQRVGRISQVGIEAMKSMSLLPAAGAVQDIMAGLPTASPSGATNLADIEAIYDKRIDDARQAGETERADILAAMKEYETRQIQEMEDQNARHLAQIGAEGQAVSTQKTPQAPIKAQVTGEIPEPGIAPEARTGIPTVESVEKGAVQPTAAEQQAWISGSERAFAFDENSTTNEGRFRLYPPEQIKPNTYKSQTSIKSRGIEATPGVRFLLADTKTGERVVQTVRFDKSKFTEQQAAEWWKQNKDKFQFYQPIPAAELAPPAEAPAAKQPSAISLWKERDAASEALQVAKARRIDEGDSLQIEQEIKSTQIRFDSAVRQIREAMKGTRLEGKTKPAHKMTRLQWELNVLADRRYDEKKIKRLEESVAEGKYGPDVYVQLKSTEPEGPVTHRDLVKQAYDRGETIPRAVLEEYKSEPWAQEALSEAEAKPKPAAAAAQQRIESVPAELRQRAISDAQRSGKNVYLRKGERGQWFTRTSPPKSGDFFTVTPMGQEIFGHVPAKLPKPTGPARGVRMMSGFDPGFDKFIAEDVKPAIAKAVEAVKVALSLAKETVDMIMGVIEPARATEKQVGKEPYVAVIKAIHRATDVARLRWEQRRIDAMDTNMAEMKKWFSSFSKEDRKNFLVAFAGQAQTPETAQMQDEAVRKLPDALKDPKVIQAIREIADHNYRALQYVVGPQVHYVKDYFYGVFKTPGEVEKFWAYWTSTDRFTKHKHIPSVADGINYGLELRHDNYLDNLMAEYMGIARLAAMKALKKELTETGKGIYIDELMEAPAEWRDVKDPVFNGWRVSPELADMINKLISTNKISQSRVGNFFRQLNNFIRGVKFLWPGFHVRVIVKAAMADSGYLGFLSKSGAYKWFTMARKADWQVIQQTPEYRKLLELGMGHRYSMEEGAADMLEKTYEAMEKGNFIGATGRFGLMPFRIWKDFNTWVFEQWIPKIKFLRNLEAWREFEAQKGRQATDWELVNIIKETQNFFGEMNERLFGRSGTATTAMRFFFMAPGFAEGNYRSIVQATSQWGVGEGWSAERSRANILNSGLITAILATIGTVIMTGRPPKKPETLDDIADLFKIDTGKKDERGRRIMIDLMDYDKDYWNIFYNVLRGRPDEAVKYSLNRLGGMKAPLFDVLTDLANVAEGKALYDWKGDRIVNITDPWLEKFVKVVVFESKKLEPIPLSVFEQSRQRHADRFISFAEAVMGLRPTLSEKDKREAQILRLCWSFNEQKEGKYMEMATIARPREAIEQFNREVRDVLEGPLVPEETREKWLKDLIIDVDRYLENEAHTASVESTTDEGKKRSEWAVKVLKNFGIGPDEATDLLRRYYQRTGVKKIRTPEQRLEAIPVLGQKIKENRLKKRMKE